MDQVLVDLWDMIKNIFKVLILIIQGTNINLNGSILFASNVSSDAN